MINSKIDIKLYDNLDEKLQNICMTFEAPLSVGVCIEKKDLDILLQTINSNNINEIFRVLHKCATTGIAFWQEK